MEDGSFWRDGCRLTSTDYSGIGARRAVEELQRCSGTQFDPRVVAAFRTILKKDHPETDDRREMADPSPLES